MAGRARAIVLEGRSDTTAYVALLRGINVGGHAKVAMSELRKIMTGLGLADVESVLQSGNVVFRNAYQRPDDLERLLETETAGQLGLRTEFILRNAEEWAGIVASNPFGEFANRDPSHLLVMILKDAPEASAEAALRAFANGPEAIELAGRQIYITYPGGIGRSRLTGTLIESKLAVRGTGRNWRTVLKLNSLLSA
jgi:uncharacterized protein (DUF1697 family)